MRRAAEAVWPGVCLVLLLAGGCRSGDKPPAQQDRQPIGSPAGGGPSPGRAGINDYNRQRESLGNLDSLVTPAQPLPPSRR
jgi:hypothetical protein